MALKVARRARVDPFIVMDVLRVANEREAAGELLDGEGPGRLDAAAHQLDDGFLVTRVCRPDAV